MVSVNKSVQAEEAAAEHKSWWWLGATVPVHDVVSSAKSGIPIAAENTMGPGGWHDQLLKG